MKKLLFTQLLLFCSSFLFAQNQPVLKPFIIQGQLKNFKEKQLYLTIINYDEGDIIDTINISDDGKFYLKTTKVTKPQLALLSRNSAQYHADIFVAPGYNLFITANCETRAKAAQSNAVTGYGALPNKYLFKRDSILSVKNDTTNFYKLGDEQLIAYANGVKHLSDSIAGSVFKYASNKEAYTALFEKQIYQDAAIKQLDMLVNHVIDTKTFTYQQSVKYIANHADAGVLKNIYNPEYLDLPSYRWLTTVDYYIYIQTLENRKELKGYSNNQALVNIGFINIIATRYQGIVKQRVLYSKLRELFRYARTFEELDNYRKALPPYIAQIEDLKKQAVLNELMAAKADELFKNRIGQPAPAFTAVDSTGKQFSNTDFKNKVIVIDLWGSWCAPCRVLTPYFKKFVEKYKADQRVAFVSISVFDEDKKWRKAMREDKPNWLQLLDNNGSVHTNYVANSVPKFVVINKQGNITTFDAPISNSFSELEKIITAEMNKN
ncbi:redoxin family protein [Mucilaginibacter lutimaris]|uniref:Redoxin family protein n=1 Tax=Mucilaginibacter lutimaris TaxID=931629 RepID=A0ABW2ZA94_9SPHI